MDEPKKHAGGRPRTGVTPKRNIRLGATWDESEAFADDNGEPMTAYVERALQAANAAERRKRARSKAAND
jgi:hypothetical protein